MRGWLRLVLIASIGSMGVAHAEPFSVRQSIVSYDGKSVVETTVYLAENDNDRKKIVALIQRQLKEDLAASPELLTVFESVGADLGRSPSSVASSDEDAKKSVQTIADGREVHRRFLSKETYRDLRQRFSSWFDRKYRICFTVTRGSINTAVTTWSLMASQDIPLPVALVAGAMTGSMSAGLQYWNPSFQTFLTKGYGHLIPHKLIREGVKKIEPFVRWYAIEVGFVAGVQIAMAAIGHAPDGTFVDVVGSNLITAISAVGAQGFWDIAVSKVTKRKLSEATTAAAALVIQRRADLITLGFSALSVSAMVGKLNGLPIADAMFGTMAVTGFGYFLKVLHTEWRCRRVLLSEPPVKSDEKDAIDLGLDQPA